MIPDPNPKPDKNKKHEDVSFEFESSLTFDFVREQRAANSVNINSNFFN